MDKEYATKRTVSKDSTKIKVITLFHFSINSDKPTIQSISHHHIPTLTVNYSITWIVFLLRKDSTALSQLKKYAKLLVKIQ